MILYVPFQDLFYDFSVGSSSNNVPDAQNSFWDEVFLEEEEEDEDDNDDDYIFEDYQNASDLNNVAIENFDHLDLPPGVEATFPWWKTFTSKEKNQRTEEDEIDVNYKNFKQFDTVQEFSDHYFFKRMPELADSMAKKVTGFVSFSLPFLPYFLVSDWLKHLAAAQSMGKGDPARVETFRERFARSLLFLRLNSST